MSQFLWVLVVIATTITRQQGTMFGIMGGTPSAFGVTDDFIV